MYPIKEMRILRMSDLVKPGMDFVAIRDNCESISNDIRKEHKGIMLVLYKEDFRKGTDFNNVKQTDIKYSTAPISVADVVLFEKQCLKNRF